MGLPRGLFTGDRSPPPKSTKEKETKDVPPPLPPSKSNEEKEVFFVVEDMPRYPGGYEALEEYFLKMQKKIAVQKKVTGKAKVAFTIDAKGKVTEIKIVGKDNDEAVKGAYAIVNGMADWKPGSQRGKIVSVKFLLPVKFK